jgi:hypothetical protein
VHSPPEAKADQQHDKVHACKVENNASVKMCDIRSALAPALRLVYCNILCIKSKKFSVNMQMFDV